MDLSLFRLLNNLAGKSVVLDAIGQFAASGLIWVMVVGLLILFAVRARPREQRHELATIIVALVAALGAYTTNVLISLLYFRPRPFAALSDVHQLIVKDAAEKSFPSDHAALAFVIAATVFLAHRKIGYIFLIAAVIVCLGRVFVGVHYLSDVLMGAVIGVLWAWLVSSNTRGIFEKMLKSHYEKSTA